MTSNVARVLPFQTLLEAGATGLARSSEAQADQVRPMAFDASSDASGQLPPALIAELDEALRLHLAL